MDAYFHYQVAHHSKKDIFFDLLKQHLQIPYEIYEKNEYSGYFLVDDTHVSYCSQFFQSLSSDLYYDVMLMLSYGDDELSSYAFSIAKKVGFFSYTDISAITLKAILAQDKNIANYLHNVFNTLNVDDIMTAETFLNQHLNARKTSESLYIHRNTLRYRLQIIHDKTGIDLHCFLNAQLFYYWMTLLR